MAQHIRELMTPNPVALPGTASVHEAARAMRDAQIGDVMVIEHDQVCGIVTDRDIVVRTVAERQDSATTILADICSHSLVTVTPTDSVEEAVRLMCTHAIRRLPVVDGGQARTTAPRECLRRMPGGERPLLSRSAATARRLPDCSSVSVRRGFVGRPSSPESPDILVDFPARFTDNISILGSRTI